MAEVIEVLVAHYNGSAYIDDQLDSIRENALPAGCELLVTVIDDCSRPEDFAKLLATCSKWPNVKIIRNEKNMGVMRTFERGLRQSAASFVMLCDQDDVWLPNKISLTYNKMREIEADAAAMVFTNLRTVDDRLRTITERMLDRSDFHQDREKHELLFQNIVTGCTIMVNRKLLRTALPFPKSLAMHDHWLALCAAFAGRIGFVAEPTLLYRQHSANLVGQPQRKLSARLRKPFRTVRQFNKGLALKARQTAELSARLPEGEEKALTAQVAEAFQNRSWTNLRFLIQARVFHAGWPILAMLCALYLLPSGPSNATE